MEQELIDIKNRIEILEKECFEAYEIYISKKQELEELQEILSKKEKLNNLGLDNIVLSKMTIEFLHLSVRSYNALKRAFIMNVADLYSWGGNIFKIRNLGIKSAREIMETLIDLGLDVSSFKFEEYYQEEL